MRYYNNVLETIGNTPLIKINRITKDMAALVLAKVETTNPGNSVKDRMALQMIEDAENEGRLKPGGTLVEGTSGNTGMGLALACIAKGYKLICTLSDKQSKEKMDILRAMGAEVYVCPTNVAPEDPRSYYSVARKLAAEIPNSLYVNQYDNLSNTKAHYLTTGPEIWDQTEGRITHFVVGVGTGGTISGVGRYLKERNPDIQILGIDTYGSVFKKYHETGIFDENEIYPYITEGIGEDILPKNVDFSVIDHFEKVTDKDAALFTRALAREEGIFVGNSAGAAIAGVLQMRDRFKPDDVVVVLFHDHGSRYVGKMFNDDWMRDRGFLAVNNTAIGLIERHKSQPLVVMQSGDNAIDAVHKMEKFDISQLPIEQDGKFVGSISDNYLYQKLMEAPELRHRPIAEIMQAPFPVVPANAGISEVSKLITKNNNAVLVYDKQEQPHIITKYDILDTLR
jgi:cystathionine beta-synthase